jgi:hypothetical protein
VHMGAFKVHMGAFHKVHMERSHMLVIGFSSGLDMSPIWRYRVHISRVKTLNSHMLDTLRAPLGILRS